VGFYQLSKLACIPFTVFIQTVFWHEQFSLRLKGSLVVLLCGIGYATVSDVLFNTLGAIFALLAVISTTLYQIWIGSKQRELEMSQFQVLHRVAPAMSLWSALATVTTETGLGHHSVLDYAWTTPAGIFILLSCAAAVGVNLSTYILIRKTSPVTYLVVGHVKTLIVLSSGFLFFKNPISADNLLGLVVAFIGVCLYSYVKRLDSQSTAPAVALSPMHSQDASETDALVEEEESIGSAGVPSPVRSRP